MQKELKCKRTFKINKMDAKMLYLEETTLHFFARACFLNHLQRKPVETNSNVQNKLCSMNIGGKSMHHHSFLVVDAGFQVWVHCFCPASSFVCVFVIIVAYENVLQLMSASQYQSYHRTTIKELQVP